MPYIANTEADRQAMLSAIGVGSIEELFASIPPSLRLNRLLDLPPALGELELTQHVAALAARNANNETHACFLGGGSYDHFIPAAVDMLASRGEFYTSYTPYQAEVSQGNLQATFEYQSLICRLTGMDVSNASLYDGGSACVEGVLMCLAATQRSGRVVLAGTVHPEFRRIIETYLVNYGTEVVVVPAEQGVVSEAKLKAAVDGDTACVLVQQPNFFGCLEDLRGAAEIAHAAGALLVASVDPVSLGLLEQPGALGADVVVAEGQSLGTPLGFGGPYLGILACREQFIRRMPGRIVGATVDRRGRSCYTLTLQTREQHIRREKATSNICTNQGLLALRATIFLSLMGPRGLRQMAELSLRKAHYAAEQLTASERFELRYNQPFFKEFVIRDTHGCVRELLAEARSAELLAGVPLGDWYPDMEDCFLIAVTEKRTRAEIDRLASSLTNVNSESHALHA